MAEHVQHMFQVIDDEEVTGYLQRVGERLLKHAPPTKLKFQFFLFDLPVANAFGLPGGRIYVSRKLVAFARSEDELAGVLGHEVGHLVARQPALDMSRVFRDVLGTTQVGDRRDIFEKYNQLVESAKRKPKAFQHSEKKEQHEQLIADSIAVHAVAGAGYSPQAFVDFWNRFAETKGKTGGWLSDLFGFTKPESKRLREMLKEVSALPPGCVEARSAASPESFQKWQAAVVNYAGLGHKESLHGVLVRKPLDPPLQGDIEHLRFSPDGRYVLAQDEASIHVLLRDPFGTLFRIDAPDAYPAQFTPDSKSIVFYNPSLRVEEWDIGDESRTDVHEVVMQRPCLQTALSPDGKTLVCYGNEFDLALYEVASGAQVFQRKNFCEPATIRDYFIFQLVRILFEGRAHFLNLEFSPDAHYLVAARNDAVLAFDLTTHAPVKLPGPLKKLLGEQFTFLGPDRIVGVNPERPQNSAQMRFPSGDLIDRLPLGHQGVAAPTHGDYLLMRPIVDYPLGVMDLKTKKIFMANKKAAFDLYDQSFVSERSSGEVGLYSAPGGELRRLVMLPRGPLAPLRAAALSPDMRWLAISGRTRGAVWDLTKGQRVFLVRGYRGAYFGEDGAVYADFPKFEKTERGIARLDLTNHGVVEGLTIEESVAQQYGAFVVLTKPAKQGQETSRNVIVEVRDTRSGKSLWSRNFRKEAPQVWGDPQENTLVFAWRISEASAKAEIEGDTALTRRMASLKEKKDDFLLEVLDARNGSVLGKLIVETGKGSFLISRAVAAGDLVLISDNENRVLVYSLATGEPKARLFGRSPIISRAGGLLCVENERGQLSLYDLRTMEKRDQFIFSRPISLTQLSDNGKRLFVLTDNQTVYLLDVSSLVKATTASSANR